MMANVGSLTKAPDLRMTDMRLGWLLQDAGTDHNV
jgi:hypothetical protein